MKKIKVAFPVCALMALALCATPANALANEASDLAFAEEEVAFVEENTVPGKAQVAAVEENLEPEEEQSFEAVSQDAQVFAEDELEVEDENTMQQEGDAEAGAQGGDHNDIGSNGKNDTEKNIRDFKLVGEVGTHYVGEDLDLTGLYWLVNYDDGSASKVDVNPSRLIGYDPQKIGMRRVYCEQTINHLTVFGAFRVCVVPGERGSSGSTGNIEGGVNNKLSAGLIVAQKIRQGSSNSFELVDGVSFDEKLEQRSSAKKQDTTARIVHHLDFADARVGVTGSVVKVNNSPFSGMLGGELIRPVTEDTKMHSHVMRLGLGYRF